MESNSRRDISDVACILGTSKLYTTTNQPQADGQSERFDETTFSALFYYIANNRRITDGFMDALTYV